MNKNLRIGLGVLMVLTGGLFTLQGLDILGGSQMSGDTLWAIIGPVWALGGVALIVARRRAKS